MPQTLTGLGVNSIASVSFYCAGAQRQGYGGATIEAWQVSLGSQTRTTAVVSNPSHGFTGWRKTTLSFVVTSATEALSFLAVGTPGGVPPFSLLDGVFDHRGAGADQPGAAGRRPGPGRPGDAPPPRGGLIRPGKGRAGRYDPALPASAGTNISVHRAGSTLMLPTACMNSA